MWVEAEYGSISIPTNGCGVRFCPHPRQLGFANAGDARPSHWRPLADQIFQALEQGGHAMNRHKKQKAKKRTDLVLVDYSTLSPRDPTYGLPVSCSVCNKTHKASGIARSSAEQTMLLCERCLAARTGDVIRRFWNKSDRATEH